MEDRKILDLLRLKIDRLDDAWPPIVAGIQENYRCLKSLYTEQCRPDPFIETLTRRDFSPLSVGFVEKMTRTVLDAPFESQDWIDFAHHYRQHPDFHAGDAAAFFKEHVVLNLNLLFCTFQARQKIVLPGVPAAKKRLHKAALDHTRHDEILQKIEHRAVLNNIDKTLLSSIFGLVHTESVSGQEDTSGQTG